VPFDFTARSPFFTCRCRTDRLRTAFTVVLRLHVVCRVLPRHCIPPRFARPFVCRFAYVVYFAYNAACAFTPARCRYVAVDFPSHVAAITLRFNAFMPPALRCFGCVPAGYVALIVVRSCRASLPLPHCACCLHGGSLRTFTRYAPHCVLCRCVARVCRARFAAAAVVYFCVHTAPLLPAFCRVCGCVRTAAVPLFADQIDFVTRCRCFVAAPAALTTVTFWVVRSFVPVLLRLPLRCASFAVLRCRLRVAFALRSDCTRCADFARILPDALRCCRAHYPPSCTPRAPTFCTLYVAYTCLSGTAHFPRRFTLALFCWVFVMPPPVPPVTAFVTHLRYLMPLCCHVVAMPLFCV